MKDVHLFLEVIPQVCLQAANDPHPFQVFHKYLFSIYRYSVVCVVAFSRSHDIAIQVMDHEKDAMWLGTPLSFNMAVLERGEKMAMVRLAAGETEAFLTWEAACVLNPTVAAAAAAATSVAASQM